MKKSRTQISIALDRFNQGKVLSNEELYDLYDFFYDLEQDLRILKILGPKHHFSWFDVFNSLQTVISYAEARKIKI